MIEKEKSIKVFDKTKDPPEERFISWDEAIFLKNLFFRGMLDLSLNENNILIISKHN
ncbi:MAG: hypothetical protein ACTSYF_03600 [Promethearchaeota archaeon]